MVSRQKDTHSAQNNTFYVHRNSFNVSGNSLFWDRGVSPFFRRYSSRWQIFFPAGGKESSAKKGARAWPFFFAWKSCQDIIIRSLDNVRLGLNGTLSNPLGSSVGDHV